MLYSRGFLTSKALSCVALCSTLLYQHLAHAQSFTNTSGVQIEEHSGVVSEWILSRPPNMKLLGLQGPQPQRKTPRISGLDSFQKVGGPLSEDYSSIGRKRLIVVLANVIAENDDGSTRFIPAPAYSAEQVKDFIFGRRDSVASQFLASSWSVSYLDGDITGDTKPDIIGPITLRYRTGRETDDKGPASDYAGGNTETMGDACIDLPILSDLINDGFVDESTPDDATPLVLVDEGVRKYFNCPWYAVTDTGSRAGRQAIVSTLEPVTANLQAKEINRLAIVHELGHAMGLDHSQGDSISYEGPNDEIGRLIKGYGDLSCMMGWGPYFGVAKYNVPQSYRLGWLPRRSTIDDRDHSVRNLHGHP